MSTTAMGTCETAWFKSSFSKEAGTCVEVRFSGGTVLMRDSKFAGHAQDQPTVVLSTTDWPTMLELALNRSSGTIGDAVAVSMDSDGTARISDVGGLKMLFSADEWDAFAKGVADGQFACR